jgi:trans-aconitate methyltransferase
VRDLAGAEAVADNSYYRHIRKDIAKLLPARASRIVDVGCGAGATLRWLQTIYPEAHTIALEGNPALRDELSHNAAEAHILDLNQDIPELGRPDLILLLDVLEHLPDPVAVLKRFVAQLSEAGTVIVSLPNVAHLSVALPLLLRGQFTYRDAGILDRTHLRFFDMMSSVDLLTGAGLRVDRKAARVAGRRDLLLDRISGGSARSRFAKQLLLRGRAGSEGPHASRWELV